MPQTPVIMIIRHGEKPTPDLAGVNEAGKNGDHHLIVRGWQRAGALVHLFAPPAGEPMKPHLVRPQYLMAACPDASGADPAEVSKREQETLSALSAASGLKLDVEFGVGDEDKVAAAAIAQGGPVLICWEHKRITGMAQSISRDPKIPGAWPGDRFDMVYVFRLNASGKGYDFEQVPQLLLDGDVSTLFPA